MPKFWIISDRALQAGGTSGEEHGSLTFWVSDNGPLDDFKNRQSVSVADFKKLLVNAADAFSQLDHKNNQEQSYVTFFVPTLEPSGVILDCLHSRVFV